jgi:hypothetical protein
MSRTLRILLVLTVVPVLLIAQGKVDLVTIGKVKDEAFNRSQAMDLASTLCDVYGGRLTGSPGYLKAAEWAVAKLKEWGIANAHIEKWGPFGRGWTNQRLSAHMLEPTYTPLIAMPLAWTGSTEGVLIGEPVYAPIQAEADMEKYKGQLKGKIVLSDAPRELMLHEKADSTRYSEQELTELFAAPTPGPMGPRRAGAPGAPNFMQMMALRKKLTAFWRDEGVGVLISEGFRNDGGTMFGGNGGSRNVKDPLSPANIIVAAEQYDRIVRLINKKAPVKLEIEVKNQVTDEPQDGYNVIAEIPGTSRKDEVVMIGGHLDGWHYATGATDNAAGSAIMLEVMRIIKKLNLPLDRTVRIGLWGGEEQGLLGSREYVKEHLADRTTMKTTAAYDKFSAYFNIDNGGGKIRGVYLQGNEAARPVWETLLSPFKDLGVTTITIRNTGGTDHQSFDGVGLPGFQFIQDTLEYNSRTHHSNMDTYERLQRGDILQMSAIMTSVVYHAANMPEMFPRKAKPGPQPAGGMGTF